MINSNYYGVVSIYFTTQTDTSFFVCTFDTSHVDKVVIL